MKVRDIITRLSRDYQPDDELLIAWWDRETTNTYDDETEDYAEVPVAVWDEAVRRMDEGHGWGDFVYEAIHDSITEHVDAARKEVTA